MIHDNCRDAVVPLRHVFDALFRNCGSTADAHKLSISESERRKLPRSSEELDLTYGEVSYDTMWHALRAAAPSPGNVFFDLGSGCGHGVLAAALLVGWSRCVGVEFLESLHCRAEIPARRFAALREQLSDPHGAHGSTAAPKLEVDCETSRKGLVEFAPELIQGLNVQHMAGDVELRCCDFFDVDLAAADVVFLCCVTWEPTIMLRLAAKLARELKDGARVLTVGKPLPLVADGGPRGAVRFQETWHAVAQLDWGQEALVLHTVQATSEVRDGCPAALGRPTPECDFRSAHSDGVEIEVRVVGKHVGKKPATMEHNQHNITQQPQTPTHRVPRPPGCCRVQ